MKLKSIAFGFTLSLIFGTDVEARILFNENFDAQPNWTIQQYNVGSNPTGRACFLPACNLPTGWNATYNGDSYCTGGPGNNNMYIGPSNARGGIGKALTFWDESCYESYGTAEDSDAVLAKKLDGTYDELFIRFFIKFQPNYQQGYLTNAAPFHKLMHIQYYSGDGTPFEYFQRTVGHQTDPFVIPGFHLYNGYVYYYINYSCEIGWNCQGTPSYRFDVGTDQDHVQLGRWENVFGDGQWHSLQLHLKMNSAIGTKDGVHKFWLDGVLKYDSSTHNGGQGIPFRDTGASATPRHGWNFISIGGNNSNRWTTSCSGTSCEQWYAIDDVVVADQFIPDTATPVIQRIDIK